MFPSVAVCHVDVLSGGLGKYFACLKVEPLAEPFFINFPDF